MGSVNEERVEKIVEAQESDESLYECHDCGELWFGYELAENVRECPHCDEKFSETEEGGRNCPECNRPTTKKLYKLGCPDCLEEVGEYTPTPEEVVAVTTYIEERDKG